MSAPLRTAALSDRDRDTLAGELREGRVFSVQPLPTSAEAYLAWALWDLRQRPLVWVVDGPHRQDLLYQDLTTLTAHHRIEARIFPALETRPGSIDPELMGERLATLQRCIEAPFPPVLITSIQALLQRTVPPGQLQHHTLRLTVGETHELDAVVMRLEGVGYDFTAEVQARGQASVRGGLLDVWPAAEPWPVRIEFFGPVVDSIRAFDPITQRSMERLTTLRLSLPQEGAGPDLTGDLCDYIPDSACWVWSDPERIREHAALYRESIDEDRVRRRTPTYRTLRQKVSERFDGGQLHIGTDGERPEGAHEFDVVPCEALPALHGRLLNPDIAEDARRAYVQALNKRRSDGWTVHLFFETEGARERFRESYSPLLPPDIPLHVGALSEGFESPALKLAIIAESDIYGHRRDKRGRLDTAVRRRPTPDTTGQRLAEWTDIQPGDLVVHFDHGIGKYLGLYEIAFGGRSQEVMTIEYADGAKLYVPVAQAHLLTRYVGVGKQRPKLHALGGRKWTRDRIVAEKAIRDLASSLLETQAHRATETGCAFPPDTHWQHEFEASFPYQETPDQDRALMELKQDMESPRPMDRLVCGDVGYGKTEVAMRAAFKAVAHNKQVAVLVPTTILAQQHYDTFSDRMDPFPINLAMLSRFQTRGEQSAVIRQVRHGGVDIVIGTHRLLQPDVAFKDLGLLIIDEEQRFGVEQKEQLKHLRTTVDVLTLTATPIPRTLYMSLTGARDMSTIQTPPQKRLPIETIVAQNGDAVVREAILRELARDGQVFYLHNRVKTIDRVKQRLMKLAPEARVAIAHGQMPEHELAEVMRRFIHGKIDVLLCTTIIESGVDIPNVNTILIERADRFGLSDLYQLRGRVGRYKHKAYAYLLLPRHGHLFDTARKRIGAIRRYSSLGAGFKLALQDLEIRGAGNLLGAEQSGHIAAVGFDLYCQLLKRSVARLRGEEVPPIVDVEVKLDFIDLATGSAESDHAAVIPVIYIEDENLRVLAYRKIAGAASEQDIESLSREFRDRFGPLPPALERLLLIATARIVAAGRGIQVIDVQGRKVMMSRGGDYLKEGSRFPRLSAADTTGKLRELVEIVRAQRPADVPPPRMAPGT